MVEITTPLKRLESYWSETRETSSLDASHLGFMVLTHPTARRIPPNRITDLQRYPSPSRLNLQLQTRPIHHEPQDPPQYQSVRKRTLALPVSTSQLSASVPHSIIRRPQSFLFGAPIVSDDEQWNPLILCRVRMKNAGRPWCGSCR